MYCWGSAESGVLGLGDTGCSVVTKPEKNQYMHERIKSVACGLSHSLILLENGTVYSCGSNRCGQLGYEDNARPTPAHVSSIKDTVSTISCGNNHNIAVTSEGSLLGWGDNSDGQLGHKVEELKHSNLPCHIPLPSLREVVQVACGSYHTMALTREGRVFSWGGNTYTQLGHSINKRCVATPTPISHLDSVPVLKLTAGTCHSFALTVTGSVFSWGKNNCGQLGLGHTYRQVVYPSLVASLISSYPVTHIASGDEHTVFLLKGGSLYSCGSNEYGQLGRGHMGYIYPLPGILMDLLMTVVTQVACGRYHTILLSKYTGLLVSFGRADHGQLGVGVTMRSAGVPISVHGYWSSPEDLEKPKANTTVVKGVYAGGNSSFATLVSIGEEGHPVDFAVLNPSIGPWFLSYDIIKQMLDVASWTNNYSNTLQTLEMLFSSPSCVNGSFLLTSPDKDNEDYCDVNLPELFQTFKLLQTKLSHCNIHQIISNAFINGLLANLPDPPPSVESLRLFVVIISYLQLIEYPKTLKILVTFIKVFLYIGDNVKSIIANWLFNGSQEMLLSWIETFRAPIATIVASGKQKIEQGDFVRTVENTNLVHLTDDQTWALQEGIKILKWLYECNKRRCEPIPYQRFYINEIVDCCDLTEDYYSFKQDRVDRVLFMRYPFVLNIAGKAELVYAEGRRRMMEVVTSAHHQNLISMFTSRRLADFSPMACVLQVRRNNLLQDTISGLLSHEATDLLKPLKILFEGEEGIDDGGVLKEFFMLLIREILNPDFGMFYQEEESNLLWFSEQIDDSDKKHYNLIGMICALAIYNSVIVDLPFPVVLYKKLLGGTGYSPDINDLEILKPSVGKHLKSLLEHKGGSDFDDIYGSLTFEVTRHFFDTIQTVPLKANGSNIHVTMENKREYVKLYVEYELVLRIQEQYEKFVEGFSRVCNTKSDVFKILHPEELVALVTGSSHYDFSELKNYTQYINGYYHDHPVIKNFWVVVNQFTVEAKKKLLVFWTGSNRVPVAGMRSMKLRIQRMDGGPDYCNLPVAHTCFNILDLPPYPSLQLMEEKISQAIYNTEGFGII